MAVTRGSQLMDAPHPRCNARVRLPHWLGWQRPSNQSRGSATKAARRCSIVRLWRHDRVGNTVSEAQ